MTLMRCYDLIANDKEEPVTGQDGLRVMQIIEAAIQSSAQKKQSIYR
jgi:predicted dehydrogenase